MKMKVAVSFGFLLLTGSFIASTRTAHAFAAGDPVPMASALVMQSGDPVPTCPKITGCSLTPTKPKLLMEN
jgi:hypothetical protein